MTPAPMTTTSTIQPSPAANVRMKPFNVGPAPVRMTPVALPNAPVQVTRATATAPDTYTPSATTQPTPQPTPATTPPEPIAAPTFRPLPGRLRLRALDAGSAAPPISPLKPGAEPLRMNSLTDATVPAQTTRAATTATGGFAAPSFGTGLAAQRSFSEALGAGARSDALAAREDRPEHAKAREAAEKLISTTLVEPILKQLRETNNAAPPFGPTPAEKQFGALLDHRLSQDIVRSANFPIVDRVARDLLRNLGDPA